MPVALVALFFAIDSEPRELLLRITSPLGRCSIYSKLPWISPLLRSLALNPKVAFFPLWVTVPPPVVNPRGGS